MRVRIRWFELVGFWGVEEKNTTTFFSSHKSAWEYVRKKLLRARKEASAFSMVSTIAVNLLSVQDRGLIDKLIKSKCKGITKAQYGYLKGIHERQEREW